MGEQQTRRQWGPPNPLASPVKMRGNSTTKSVVGGGGGPRPPKPHGGGGAAGGGGGGGGGGGAEAPTSRASDLGRCGSPPTRAAHAAGTASASSAWER